MRQYSFMLIFLFILPSLACTQKKIKKDFNPEVSARLVKEGALLIDVRTVAEFKTKHIAGAINIPYKEIQSNKNFLNKITKGDKNKTIVVYCQRGPRAAVAKKSLKNLGYTSVVNHGGIESWKK